MRIKVSSGPALAFTASSAMLFWIQAISNRRQLTAWRTLIVICTAYDFYFANFPMKDSKEMLHGFFMFGTNNLRVLKGNV